MRVNTVVSLTFDDGLASQFLVRDVLHRRSLQATFFVSSGLIDTGPPYLSWTQLADLAAAGHEIGGHTLYHPRLTDLRVDEASRQVAEDRQRLLDRGFTASSFAYPYGAFDEQARAVVAASGYRSARRSWGLCSRPGDGCPCAEQIPPRDPLATLTASTLTSETDLSEIQAVVLRAEASGGWLQLVFHDVLDDGGLYSMSLELFEQCVEWIDARAERGTVVRTVGDVIGGNVIPRSAVASLSGTGKPGPVLAPAPQWSLPRGETPSFSVIVPAREAADLIGEAIESALAQTLPAHEILVYDDGGDDDLRRALEPYSDGVELLRGAHIGVAGARNAAVARATGEFVVTLDADDRFLPDRLEALGELAAARPDLDVLATDAFIDVAGTSVGRFNRQTPFEVDDQRTAILERCFFAWPAIRRSRLLAIGGFDESLQRGSDWECAIRLVLSGCVAGLVDEPLYRYRLRPGSLTAARREALRDRVKLLETTLGHRGLSPSERRKLCDSLASARRKLLRAEAEVSLREGRSDARTRSMRLARAEGAPTRMRMQALAWSLAPRWAGRRIEADARRRGTRSLASTAPWQA